MQETNPGTSAANGTSQVPVPSVPEGERGTQELIRTVWNEKYRHVSPDGTSAENEVNDTHARVVAGVYKKDPNKAAAGDALQAMFDLRWCPGGRIHAGAGLGRRVTLLNCYANETIHDSMEGIMRGLSIAALTQQQGGGIGTDFSTIRPRGAVVKKTGSISSGVIPFMRMWDAMCMTIKSSGSRRGAMMATLRVDHPDVYNPGAEDFITVKHKKGELVNFNVSVLVTDPFMKAVQEDKDWDLGFGVPRADGQHVEVKTVDGKEWFVYRRVRARELWEQILKSTYEYAEPGVIFIDRVNKTNNLYYVETICTTNPCLVGDTWVTSPVGAKRIEDCTRKPMKLALEKEFYSTRHSFFKTGVKPVFLVKTKEGFEVEATDNHQFKAADGSWLRVEQLLPSEKLKLSRGSLKPTAFDPKAYIVGFLLGDGWFNHKEGRAGLQASREDYPYQPDVVGQVYREGFGESLTWSKLGDRNQFSARSRKLYHFLGEKGIQRKRLDEAEGETPNFLASLIGGLTDVYGTYYKAEKGSYVRIYQSDKALLQDVQRVLLRFGIYSKIYKQRTDRKGVEMPGGKYDTKAQYCLHVSGQDLTLFLEVIPVQVKAEAAKSLLSVSRKSRYKKPAVATVTEIVPNGEKEVYDVQVPGPNAYEANGFISHNCGEQPLPPDGDCNLGAVNLARMVADPFGHNPWINFEELRRVTKVGVRFLDNVLDVTNFPTAQQKVEALAKRRIGLGITGLGNMLQMMKVRYGSKESTNIVEHVMRTIAVAAYEASIELAQERGPFPAFDKYKYLEAPFIKRLPEHIRKGIAVFGIRNSVLLTVAPTGTTSIYYGNISSGIEPTFAWEYSRLMLAKDDTQKKFLVQDYGLTIYARKVGKLERDEAGNLKNLPPYMVTATELTVDEHLAVQAACQWWVDASISKTINCDPSMSFEEFQKVYEKAYNLGLKGCTTYRPSGVRGAVLSIEKEKAPPPPTKNVQKEWVEVRPEVLRGATYKVKWPMAKDAFYVTINDIETEEGRRPFEIFINSKSAVHHEWIVALTRTISAVFRRGGDIGFLVEELEQVYSLEGGAWVNGEHIPSLVALIGRTIKKHRELYYGESTVGNGEQDGHDSRTASLLDQSSSLAPQPNHGEVCPSCNKLSLTRQEGCKKCYSCGYSSCG